MSRLILPDAMGRPCADPAISQFIQRVAAEEGGERTAISIASSAFATTEIVCMYQSYEHTLSCAFPTGRFFLATKRERRFLRRLPAGRQSHAPTFFSAPPLLSMHGKFRKTGKL